MSRVFQNTSNLSTLELSNFDTSQTTVMDHLFANSGLVSINLSNWNTSSSPTATLTGTSSWLTGVSATIYCNDPNNGGVAATGTGTVLGTSCSSTLTDTDSDGISDMMEKMLHFHLHADVDSDGDDIPDGMDGDINGLVLLIQMVTVLVMI